jgi:predicted Zn-dependent peptidase
MTTTPMTSALARPVPALGRAKTPRLPSVGERTLDNGLRVLAVRRPGVPLVELRLRVPFAGPAGKGQRAHTARGQLLGDTLLSGTGRRSAEQIAIDLQALGGQLSASTDSDRIGMGGSVLTSGLPGLLELLAEVLTDAAYPKAEVLGERDRLVQELAIYRSSAGVVAREALLGRLYGSHPYGRDLPSAEDVEKIKASHLRQLHAERVAPQGSVLVLVGDLPPARALGLVEQALSGWKKTGKPPRVPDLPPTPSGPALLLDRPGAVQTTVRAAGPAPARADADFASLVLANLVFGGYFSSRWVANIREDKGYTYSPHAVLEHPPAGSRIMLSADVATPTTAAALVETSGSSAGSPPSRSARRSSTRPAATPIGSLRSAPRSQAGLASTLSQLAAPGCRSSGCASSPKRLAAVTVDDALAAAARYLAPARLTTVLVGDVAQVEGPVRGVLDRRAGVTRAAAARRCRARPSTATPPPATTTARWRRLGARAVLVVDDGRRWSTSGPGPRFVLVDSAAAPAGERLYLGRDDDGPVFASPASPAAAGSRPLACARSAPCSTTGRGTARARRRARRTGTPPTRAARGAARPPRWSGAARPAAAPTTRACTSAHRPGDDRPGPRRRGPLRPRPAGGLADRQVLHAGRLRRVGESAEQAVVREVAEEDRARRRHGRVRRQPAVAVPGQPDARLHGRLRRRRREPPPPTTSSRTSAGSRATSCATAADWGCCRGGSAAARRGVPWRATCSTTGWRTADRPGRGPSARCVVVPQAGHDEQPDAESRDEPLDRPVGGEEHVPEHGPPVSMPPAQATTRRTPRVNSTTGRLAAGGGGRWPAHPVGSVLVVLRGLPERGRLTVPRAVGSLARPAPGACPCTARLP